VLHSFLTSVLEVFHTLLFIWLFLSATINLTIAAFILILYFAHIFHFTPFPCVFVSLFFFFLFVMFETFLSVVLPPYNINREFYSFSQYK